MSKEPTVKKLEKETKKIRPKKPNHIAIVRQKVINLNTNVELVKNDIELIQTKIQSNKDEIIRAIEWLKAHSDKLAPIEEKLEDIIERLEQIENDRFWESVDKT
jgi:chromosome segregation ATPase